jgi:hypothetical protein
MLLPVPTIILAFAVTITHMPEFSQACFASGICGGGKFGLKK